MIAVAQEINWTTVIVAVCTALPATLVAWAALRKTVETGKKADTIIEKAVEIHTLTNSNLSAVTKSLEVANEKISGLEKLIANFVGQKQVTETKEATIKTP